jgi:uncharacterized RDD family membrane protein YckC
MNPIDYNSPDQQLDPFAGRQYAGFWWRVLAFIIDAIALAIVQQIILFFLRMAGVHLEPRADEMAAMMEEYYGDVWGIFTETIKAQVPLMIFGYILQWLYFAIMESSPKQGTLGKMALGITVTDMEGKRISFLHATGRYWAKSILALVTLGIAYIFAGFTEKKQALHDMVAGTLVWKKD